MAEEQAKKRPKKDKLEPSVLFWDMARFQQDEEVVNTLQQLNCQVVVIDAGYTGVEQMNDVGVNEPFKTRLGAKWEDRIAALLCRDTSVKLQPPSRFDVIDDVVQTLDELQQSLRPSFWLPRTYAHCLGPWMQQKLQNFFKLSQPLEFYKKIPPELKCPSLAFKVLTSRGQIVSLEEHSASAPATFATSVVGTSALKVTDSADDKVVTNAVVLLDDDPDDDVEVDVSSERDSDRSSSSEEEEPPKNLGETQTESSIV